MPVIVSPPPEERVSLLYQFTGRHWFMRFDELSFPKTQTCYNT
jgi:hypothetical protein